MNKVLLALLLVCVLSVSVQAFVKRDAPATADTNHQIEDIMKQITELGQASAKKLQENINPDHIKDEFQKLTNQFLEEFSKMSSSNKGSVANSV